MPAGLLTGLRNLRSLQIASYSHSLPAGFFAGSRQLRAVTFSVGSFAARPGSSLDVSLEEGGSDHCFKVEILQGAPIRTAVRYKATVRPPAPGAAYDDNNFDTRAFIEAGDTQSGDICVPSRQADGNHAEGTKITVVLTEPSFAQYSVSSFMDGLYYSDVAPLNLQVGDKSSHTDAAIYLGPDREQEGEILKFPVRLTRSVSSDVTVLWKTADETAKAPGDYMAVSNGSLTIKAGDTKGVIEVRTVEDTERERHETLKVLFDTAATSLPAGVVFANTEAQGTIGNDDTGVTFQGDGSCSIREGDEHTINVVLSHDVVRPIAVIISAVGGTAGSGDYSLQGGSILLHEFTTTFGSRTKLVATDDNMDDGEKTVTISLSFRPRPDMTLEVDDEPMTCTLTDNDDPPTGITLTASPGSVAEGADPTGANVTVTATVNGGTTWAAAKAVTVVVGSGTATEGTDFASVADFTITIPAGSANATGSFTLDPTEDVIDEGAGETVSIAGSTTANDTVDATEVTITDNDDAPAKIVLTVDPGSVAESANPNTPNVTVTAAVAGGTTYAAAKAVTVVVGSGTAVEGTDFSSVADFTITIPAGSASATGTFTLDPTEDVIDEGAGETVSIAGSTTANDTVDATEVTITDNDDAPAKIVLTASPGSVAESANPNTPNVTVTAAVAGGTTYAAAKAVTVVVGSGTATEGTDFGAVADFTITIPAGSASATGTFTLDPTEDVIDEGAGETVSIAGSTTANDTVDATEVTITDNDDAPAKIVLTASPGSVAESANPNTPNVTVTAAVAGGTTYAADKAVTVVVGSGTAVEGTDFSNVADFTITIPAGSASATGRFTLDPTEDAIDEGAGETVSIAGSTTANDTVDATEVTIADNDDAPAKIVLTASPGSVDEDADPTAANVTVTATVAGGTTWAAAKAVTVVVGSGTAVEGTDFSNVADFTITIPAGASSATGTFTLDPTEDVIDEGAGETVSVDGSTPASDTVDGTTVTIADNDDAPAKIVLTVDPGSVVESANPTSPNVTVTAAVAGGTTYAAAKVVTVVVGDGTATEGTDFGAVADFTITIPAGASSATGRFTLNPTEDAIDEGAGETVSVTGSTPASDTVDATEVTIADNDDAPAKIVLTVDPGSVVESADPTGANVTVTATVDGGTTYAADKAVTVVVGSGTATEGTDFASVADFTITIPAGSASATGRFTLDPTEDVIDEGTGETVSVTGSTPASDTVDATEVTIADNDGAPTGITLTASPESVVESANATTVTVTATVNGTTAYAADKAVTVVVGSGTATEGTDFASVADFTITIPAGASSATGTFTLDPTEDVIDEGAGETVSIAGSTTANDTVDATEVTITDNDDAPAKIVLTASPGSVAESANPNTPNVTVTAAVAGGTTYAAAKAVTVVVGSGTATEGTDFSNVADFTITIPAGSASATGTFTLDPTEDVIDEGAGETVSIAGSTTANDTVDATEVTIADNDDAPAKIVLTASPGSVAESANPNTPNVTVTAAVAGGTTYAADKAVTVVVGSGTAVEGTDFSNVADFTITIPAGSASATGTFTLDPTEDAIDEGAGETVSIAGSTTANDTVDATEVTITDNDDAPAKIVLTASPGSVAESANPNTPNVTVTAAVAGGTTYAADKAVTVVVGSGTATEGTDFSNVADFTITIPAGSASATGTFTLDPTEDVIDEGAGETVSIAGSTTANDTVDATEVTIADNDDAPAKIVLTASPGSVAESANPNTPNVTVTAAVAGGTTYAADKAVTVVVGSGTAVEGTDFSNVADFTITIPAGSASATGTFTLDPTEDAIDEGAGETVSIAGSTTANDTVDATEVTITDNDDAPAKIVLTASPGSVDEDADPTAANVTVTAAVAGGTTYAADKAVTVVVGSGTATEGTDFSNVADFTITIPAGSASATGRFTLDPTEDVIDEGAGETVSIAGSTTANDTVDATEVTITDNDDAPAKIVLTASPGSVDEDADPNTPNVTVTAAVAGGTTYAADKAVTVVVGSGTAVEGTDFSNVADFTITIPAGSASATGTFTLDPTEDVIDEGAGETVSIAGSTTANDTVDATEVTITDNDDAPAKIVLTASPGSVAESANPNTPNVTVTAAVAGGTTYAADKAVTVVVGSGTAVEGTDFSNVADFTITIPAGSASATGTFTLDPTEDVIDEGAGETVSIAGSTTANDTVDATEVTIADNDDAPAKIVLTASPGSVAESANPNTPNVTVTAAVAGGTTYAADKAVTVVVGSGTAVEGTDFSNVADFTITIPAGSASATGRFTLDPTEDAIDEGAGETVSIAGSTTANDTVDATEVTIADNDDAPAKIVLTASPGSVDESANPTAANVTVTADGGGRDDLRGGQGGDGGRGLGHGG